MEGILTKKALPIMLLLMAMLILLAGCTVPAASVQAVKTDAPAATSSLVATASPVATVSPAATASPAAPAASTKPPVVYKDGVYEVTGVPDAENYYVKDSLTIKDGKITAVDWAIYDAGRQDKLFDKNYEEVFAGQNVYIQQCRDNLKGMEQFAPKLIETQDLFQVDVVSGATWACDKFWLLVAKALNQAKVK